MQQSTCGAPCDKSHLPLSLIFPPFPISFPLPSVIMAWSILPTVVRVMERGGGGDRSQREHISSLAEPSSPNASFSSVSPLNTLVARKIVITSYFSSLREVLQPFRPFAARPYFQIPSPPATLKLASHSFLSFLSGF